MTNFDELYMAITKKTLLPKLSRYHNDVHNKDSLELDYNSENILYHRNKIHYLKNDLNWRPHGIYSMPRRIKFTGKVNTQGQIRLPETFRYSIEQIYVTQKKVFFRSNIPWVLKNLCVLRNSWFLNTPWVLRYPCVIKDRWE